MTSWIGRFANLSAFAAIAVCCTAGAAAPKLERLTVEASAGPMIVWSRRPANPTAVIVLVHGRTWSARPGFDFEPDAGSRSLLKALAAAGFATYAIDLRGYGETPRVASGWLTPTQSVEDVESALKFAAARHPNLPVPVLLGWSRGSKIAALLGTRGNQPLSALILYAFTFDPSAPPLNGPASGKPLAAANTAEAAKSDFISPEVASPALIRDFVSAALAADPTRVDVCCDVEFQDIHPEAIHVPTLLIQGAKDPGIKPEAAAVFFSHLASPERRWIVIGRGDHAAHLEDTATEVSTAIVEFINASVTPGARHPRRWHAEAGRKR